MIRRTIPTPDGEFAAGFSANGLRRLRFPGSEPLAASEPEFLAPASQQTEHWFELTREALLAILAGHNVPKLPPLDLASGTDFQRRIWQALLEIPAGETRTYQEIARRIGSPGATRAVGNACGANPIPVLIPCHRVIAAHGRIGGFSSDMDWKIRLLEREGSWPLAKSPVGATQGWFDLQT